MKMARFHSSRLLLRVEGDRDELGADEAADALHLGLVDLLLDVGCEVTCNKGIFMYMYMYVHLINSSSEHAWCMAHTCSRACESG